MKKRSRKGLVTIVLLSVALAAAASALAFYLVKLDDATSRIAEQEVQLEEQRQLIEKKQTFGAAMESLMVTASQFNGVQLASIIPIDRYQAIASRAWAHRWDSRALERDTTDALSAIDDLDSLLADASVEAAINSTGTTYEAVIDRLGAGFIATVIDDADTLCETDVLACVSSDDPLTVHFDEGDMSLPYMSDRLHTGIAYHEHAHVLQMMNPVQTEAALKSFDGDEETMADCYALVYLDGWTLEHRVWMNDFEYWDVSVGYGHVCTNSQRAVIRDWYEQLGPQWGPLSQ
jgi:hypothetical protein